MSPMLPFYLKQDFIGWLDRWFRSVKESIVCEWWNADKKSAFGLVLTIIVQLLQCPSVYDELRNLWLLFNIWVKRQVKWWHIPSKAVMKSKDKHRHRLNTNMAVSVLGRSIKIIYCTNRLGRRVVKWIWFSFKTLEPLPALPFSVVSLMLHFIGFRWSFLESYTHPASWIGSTDQKTDSSLCGQHISCCSDLSAPPTLALYRSARAQEIVSCFYFNACLILLSSA